MIGKGSMDVELLLTGQHSLSTFLIEKQSPCISNMPWVLKNTIIFTHMNKEMEEYDPMDKKSSVKEDFFESFPGLPHFHLFM